MKISGFSECSDHFYKIESEKTLELGKELREENYEKTRSSRSKEALEKYLEKIESGTDAKIRIARKGEEYYRVGRIGGDYLVKDNPGDYKKDVQEKLQLPPCNKATVKSRVELAKPQIVLDSRIKSQPDWAKECGYQAVDSSEQTVLLQNNKSKTEDRYLMLEQYKLKKGDQISGDKGSDSK